MPSPIVVIAPTPPPMHGAALATERLIGVLQASGIPVEHVNAKYAESVDGLGNFSVRKIKLMLAYLFRVVGLALKYRKATFIVEPAMYFGPFVKDAVFVLTLRCLGARVVAWHHMALASMWMSVGASKWKRLVVRFVLQRVSHHVVAGNSVKDQLLELIPEENIHVIPNGVPAESQDCGDSSDTNSNDVFRVLYLSNMGEAKGYRILLEAAKQLAQKHDNMCVDFYGNLLPGQSQPELLEEFANMKGDCAVAYHGPIYGEDKARAYCQADVFVLPSFNEAFPLTILEAMSVGTAVVATDVGSVSDAVLHEETGFVVEPKNVQALADRLEQLYADRNLCKQFGLAGKKRFQELYTMETFGINWREFLKEQ